MVCTWRTAGPLRDAVRYTRAAVRLSRGFPSRGGRRLNSGSSADVDFPQPKSPDGDALGKPRCSTMVDPGTGRLDSPSFGGAGGRTGWGRGRDGPV